MLSISTSSFGGRYTYKSELKSFEFGESFDRTLKSGGLKCDQILAQIWPDVDGTYKIKLFTIYIYAKMIDLALNMQIQS